MSSGLDVVDLRAGYGAVEALHGVTLSFPLGAVVALLGRNGAGKSSLLRVMAGTVAVSSGRVSWRGRDLARLPPDQRVVAGLTSIYLLHEFALEEKKRELDGLSTPTRRAHLLPLPSLSFPSPAPAGETDGEDFFRGTARRTKSRNGSRNHHKPNPPICTEGTLHPGNGRSTRWAGS